MQLVIYTGISTAREHHLESQQSCFLPPKGKQNISKRAKTSAPTVERDKIKPYQTWPTPNSWSFYVPKPTATHTPTLKDRSWGGRDRMMIYDHFTTETHLSSKVLANVLSLANIFVIWLPKNLKLNMEHVKVKNNKLFFFFVAASPMLHAISLHKNPSSASRFLIIFQHFATVLLQSKCLGICLDSGIGSPSLDCPVDLPRNFESSSSTWGQDWTSGKGGPITVSHGYTK